MYLTFEADTCYIKVVAYPFTLGPFYSNVLLIASVVKENR